MLNEQIHHLHDYIGRELCNVNTFNVTKNDMEIPKIPLVTYWFEKPFLFFLVTNEVLTMSQA
jgi:hypothetical protein